MSYLRPLLPLLAVASGTLTIGFYLLQNVQVKEIAFPVIGIVATVVFAALSGYFAAAARRLQRTPRVFISYARGDERLAELLCEALDAKGMRVWLDRDQLRLGENWRIAIERAISDADTVVLLAPMEDDERVGSEMLAAERHHVRVIPVITRDTPLPKAVRHLHSVDVRGYDEHRAAEIVASSLSSAG